MMSIEDTDNLIRTMRAQARALDAGADALEAAMAPIRQAMEGFKTLSDATQSWAGFWEDMAKKALSPTKEGK